ncbi:MAG: permease [Thermoplasmata archaeon]|nr:permease [Thermoplasmata archaeon]
MNITAIMINGIALIGLLIAFIKDKEKAIMSLKIAGRSFIKILPMAFIIIIVIGLILGFISPDMISQYMGDDSGILGVLIVGIFGAMMYIPALLSFPLAASFLDGGASITTVATFILTLTMVGTVTISLEIRELGKKIALLRNGISFIIAIIIGLLMGMIL